MEEYEYDWIRIWLSIFIIILLIIIIATVILFKYNQKVSNRICSNKMIEAKDLTLIVMVQQINDKGYVDIGVGEGQMIRLAPVQMN